MPVDENVGIDYEFYDVNEDELDIPKLTTANSKMAVVDGKLRLEDDEERRIEEAYIRLAKDDFMVFTRGLIIDSQTGPQIFENCMAQFQKRFFDDIALSLDRLRDGEQPDCQRWWMERTKKGSKDADLAIISIWLIAFPKRPFLAQVGAADGNQAGIVKNRINVLLHLNPWLNNYVELIQSKIRSKRKLINGSPMAIMDVINTDIAGAHGETPDLLIINELSHITKWEFVENLMSNAAGVARGVTIIATNAGYKGTKAEMWRKNAVTSTSWKIHCLSKPAPWHSKDHIEDEERRNTRGKFLRLWKGKWVSGKGDALDEEDVEACFCLDGPTLEVKEGWDCVAGLDLGVSHDHSALLVLGINFAEQKLKVMYWKAWAPEASGEVNLEKVENACVEANKQYRLNTLFYDPSQAVLMSQRLKKRLVPMREMSFNKPVNLMGMASSLIQVTESRILECYDDADGRLRDDLGKFNIVEKSYGYKLEAVSDETGHADVGTALVICLPYAVEALGMGLSRLLPDDVIADSDDTPLSEEEIQDLPQEFFDLYKMDQNEELEERA